LSRTSRSTACVASISGTARFDLERPWALDSRVALRPEPFGALAYHFGTRRLSFLKTRKLVAVVERLGQEPSGRGACLAAGVSEMELPTYTQALANLAESGLITSRDCP
jgi:putative mycofactocin binding protein MftB